MSFLETPRFPDRVAFGTQGGPSYKTEVIVVGSGFEQRNINWADSRHLYNASMGIKSLPDMEATLAMFHAARGRAHGFRFKDFVDYQSSAYGVNPTAFDQTLATGDGVTASFQMLKDYTQGTLTYKRDITKPVIGTGLVGLAGFTIPSTQAPIDYTTGIITFVDASDTVTNAVSSGSDTDITQPGAHSLGVGDTMFLDTFTGDWAGLNNTRFTIIGVTGPGVIKIAFDSSAYATYSSNAGAIITLPQSAEVITAGFDFDVPVRFDTDRLSISLEDYNVGAVSVPLVEIRV